MVVIWPAKRLNPEGRPTRDFGSLTYSGVIARAASRDTDLEPSASARRVRRAPSDPRRRRGVVEAVCKSVVGVRLKQAGMRWTVAGANDMIALRCCALSGCYEDYWVERAENAKISIECRKSK